MPKTRLFVPPLLPVLVQHLHCIFFLASEEQSDAQHLFCSSEDENADGDMVQNLFGFSFGGSKADVTNNYVSAMLLNLLNITNAIEPRPPTADSQSRNMNSERVIL